MFNVVEIDKTNLYENSFAPYDPYVYKSIVSVTEGGIVSYWTDTFGADGTYDTESVQINP